MIKKELLKSISIKAIELGDVEFSIDKINAQWLGNKPASDEEIQQLTERLGIQLPADYEAFLRMSNGFLASSYTEPNFMETEKVDLLRNIDSELISIWRETGNREVADLLQSSICVGGKGEEQLFLLIPPSDLGESWTYWKFAPWIPGEEPYDNLMHYFESIDAFLSDLLDMNDSSE